MEKLLFESCKAMGIDLYDKQLEQFEQYEKILLEWNKKVNLTAITEHDAIALRHFADSVSIGTVPNIDFSNKKMIDVGTGAGFPGIPLKIVHPTLEVTLLDSLQKRIKFLNAVITQLSLTGITAIHSRAEDGGQNAEYREQFDIAVSRALAPMPVLLEYCLPFVKVGGLFLSLKGPNVEDEMLNTNDKIKLLGGKPVSIEAVEIPFSDLHHSLVVIEKISKTPMSFPRKAGKIDRHSMS